MSAPVAVQRDVARDSAAVVAGVAFLLALLGLLIIFSVTTVAALLDGAAVSRAFMKQCFWVVVATALCVTSARIDYRRLMNRAGTILVLVWIGLIATLIFGAPVNGARRWISFGVFGLQMSEFAKLAVILACARFAMSRRDRLASFRLGFAPAAIWLGITVLLIAVEPDFGTSMFVLGLGLVLLHLGGIKLAHMALTGILAMPLFLGFMAWRYGHILSRLRGFTDGPHEQVLRALNALGSGGLTGRGPGEGRSHLWFLWEVETDFIFAALGEQFGLVGTIGVISLFALLFWHGLRIALRAADFGGFLIAFGVTFMIALQAAVNMSVVTGIVPPKGIGLPFVSYGGSSLLMLGTATGLLLSVALHREPWAETSDENETGLSAATDDLPDLHAEADEDAVWSGAEAWQATGR